MLPDYKRPRQDGRGILNPIAFDGIFVVHYDTLVSGSQKFQTPIFLWDELPFADSVALTDEASGLVLGVGTA
jgi:hypothetical protein